MQLNDRAVQLTEKLINRADELRIAVSTLSNGCRLVDCGLEVAGGLRAGAMLARVCLADLAEVRWTRGTSTWDGPWLQITCDHPVAACLASQYAGWQVAAGEYFAMASGPMRSARGSEPLFETIGLREHPSAAVGVLETRHLPPANVCEQIAADCGVPTEQLTLLVAPTASLAGAAQVVARSLETCLHKMFEIGFDMRQVVSGIGLAPLPPIGKNDLIAMGRTNDAVLYAGMVTIWLRGDDSQLRELGPKVPSSASADYGEPFCEIFRRYNNDFYQVDPLLFSPAVVRLENVDTGTVFCFGRENPEVVKSSFAG